MALTRRRPHWAQPPTGRLTLTTAVPVLSADVSAATTVYYTPYVGNLVPVSDGSNFWAAEFSELSQATTDNTKSPAAVAADSNYDIFVWNDLGTLRATRGPAWASGTSRGTGAGTTELTRLKGLLVNAVAITNGPAANMGTYVGTIRSNGSSQIDMQFAPAAAAGGAAAKLHVWNAYNRRLTASQSRENTDSWTYTTGTVRPANNSTSNRISWIQGLSEGAFAAHANVYASNDNAGVDLAAGIGLDSTTAFTFGATAWGDTPVANVNLTMVSRLLAPATLGSHFVQMLEYSTATGTTTWKGDGGGSTIFSAGISLSLEM